MCERSIDGFRALAEQALTRAGALDPATAARLFVAGIDGLLVASFATTGAAPPPHRLRDDITALLRGLS